MKENNEAKDRIQWLVDAIPKWNNSYRDGNPDVTDIEYDAAFKELADLELLYPEYCLENTPTGKIKQTIDPKMRTMKHLRPMVSLETMVDFSETPLLEFMDRVAEFDPDAVIVSEFKYDGFAISLRYKEGHLVHAVTRGDGEQGEDITTFLQNAKNIPTRMDPRIVEIRGEIYMATVDFDALVDEQKSDGLEPYRTPRNAAAGIGRAHSSPYKDFLSFAPYEVYGIDLSDSYLDRLAMLDPYTGKNITQIKRSTFTASEKGQALSLREKEATIEAKNQSLIPCDGLVYKVDSTKIREKMGATSQWPRWAIAHKFRPAEASVKLKEIHVTVGRTGRVTPNGVFSPFYLGGVEVSAVSLHNEATIQTKDLRVGDYVVVQRAGDVIPHVDRLALPLNSQRAPVWTMPATCPSCGGPLAKKAEDGAHYFCTAGYACKAQEQALFEYACSRNVLDIKGLGEALIEKLIHTGALKRPEDIFKLTEEEITGAGTSPLVAKKVVEEVQKAKTAPLGSAIAMLGIFSIGPSLSGKLAKLIHFLPELADLTKERLLEVEDFGEARAQAVIDWCAKKINLVTLEELSFITSFIAPANSVYNGKSVCVTGSFRLHRDEVKKLLENEGFKVVSDVSKKTAAVITGESATASKVTKAQKLEIPVFHDPELKLAWLPEVVADVEDPPF